MLVHVQLGIWSSYQATNFALRHRRQHFLAAEFRKRASTSRYTLSVSQGELVRVVSFQVKLEKRGKS